MQLVHVESSFETSRPCFLIMAVNAAAVAAKFVKYVPTMRKIIKSRVRDENSVFPSCKLSTKSKFALHPYQSTNSKLGNLNAAKGKYLKRIPPSGLDVGLRREERKKLLSNEGERNLRSSRARTFRHSASLSHMPLPSFSSAERERERPTEAGKMAEDPIAAAAAAATARVVSLWRRGGASPSPAPANLQAAGRHCAATAAATVEEDRRYCKTLSFIFRVCGEGLATL